MNLALSNTEEAKKVAEDWHKHWSTVDDFIKYNPGARHRRRQVFSAIKNISFNSLLDVGCGNGELISEIMVLRPEVNRIHGCDISESVLEKNRIRYPKATFSTIDLERGGPLSEQFDLVSCCEVIEHLWDRRKAFQNLTEMVKPNGHILITCPAGYVFNTERYWGHTIHPTVQEIREHARLNNLEVVSINSWGWPFYYLLKFVTNINSEWSIKNFGTQSYGPVAKLISTLLYWFNFINLPNFYFGCQITALLKKK